MFSKLKIKAALWFCVLISTAYSSSQDSSLSNVEGEDSVYSLHEVERVEIVLLEGRVYLKDSFMTAGSDLQSNDYIIAEAKRCPCSNVDFYCLESSDEYCKCPPGTALDDDDISSMCWSETELNETLLITFILMGWCFLMTLIASFTNFGRNAREFFYYKILVKFSIFITSCLLNKKQRHNFVDGKQAVYNPRIENIISDKLAAEYENNLIKMRQQRERLIGGVEKGYIDSSLRIESSRAVQVLDVLTDTIIVRLLLNKKVFLKECNQTENISCPICLTDFEDGDSIGHLRCKHLFHSACLKKWLVHKNSCPMCFQECGHCKVKRAITNDLNKGYELLV